MMLKALAVAGLCAAGTGAIQQVPMQVASAETPMDAAAMDTWGGVAMDAEQAHAPMLDRSPMQTLMALGGGAAQPQVQEAWSPGGADQAQAQDQQSTVQSLEGAAAWAAQGAAAEAAALVSMVPTDGFVCHQGPREDMEAMLSRLQGGPLQKMYALAQLSEGPCEAQGFAESLGQTCFGNTFAKTPDVGEVMRAASEDMGSQMAVQAESGAMPNLQIECVECQGSC
mmetsp:Transcript_84635/g.240065  ORF Transcript_84635/g.240065 Transcript_84635/m.240065 type:complete len:226 (+) Transcript_84635:77-754(+)